MTGFLSKATSLILLLALLSGAGVIYLSYVDSDITITSFLALASGFAFYCFIIIAISDYGRVRKPDKSALFSLLSVGLKFIFPLILALLWFLVAKKSSTTGLIIFFVLSFHPETI